ncbi:MAG: Spx/MgsR family RNA polymerase-binding regulatory protein [Synechococcaceae cyanobacterium]
MTAAPAPHRVFSYAACSTCRKALAWLASQGLHPGEDFTVIDITTSPPDQQELRRALSQLGRNRLFNTSGQSYRALGAAAVKAMSDDEAIAALAADGRLMKRPFLITANGAVATGFKPEDWQPLLEG